MIFAFLVGAGLFSAVVGIFSAMAGQMYERRKWERRMLEKAGLADFARSAPERTEHSPARLERLEQAVEAIAIEMERVGEGQRFVTKLLAERRVDRSSDTPRSPMPGAVHSARPTTPH